MSKRILLSFPNDIYVNLVIISKSLRSSTLILLLFPLQSLISFFSWFKTILQRIIPIALAATIYNVKRILLVGSSRTLGGCISRSLSYYLSFAVKFVLVFATLSYLRTIKMSALLLAPY